MADFYIPGDLEFALPGGNEFIVLHEDTFVRLSDAYTFMRILDTYMLTRMAEDNVVFHERDNLNFQRRPDPLYFERV